MDASPNCALAKTIFFRYEPEFEGGRVLLFDSRTRKVFSLPRYSLDILRYLRSPRSSGDLERKIQELSQELDITADKLSALVDYLKKREWVVSNEPSRSRAIAR